MEGALAGPSTASQKREKPSRDNDDEFIQTEAMGSG